MLLNKICRNINDKVLNKSRIDYFLISQVNVVNELERQYRYISNYNRESKDTEPLKINDKYFSKDSWTNITPKIISLMDRQLHNKQYHPLQMIKQRIIDYIRSQSDVNGEQAWSIHDRMNPVVTTTANFDSLLVPIDHPSRKKSDSYYINSSHMLRAHTSAHQAELIKMGHDNFLVVGDVYRRDEIDSTHYPVFHQIEGVRLIQERDLNKIDKSFNKSIVKGFEQGVKSEHKQQNHTKDAVKILEKNLKTCLTGLALELFGPDTEYKWVDCYFPFTHPSWELEIKYQGKWLEVLGCGIIEQEILRNAGSDSKLGFAFGLGLERLAMILYQIPDIRLFWSNDSGFLKQFVTNDIKSKIVYSSVSKHPQCVNDISFWLPLPQEGYEFSKNDFYDLIRSLGGDLIEQVECFDEFFHPKKQRKSQSYHITYRHMERTLTQEEVNKIHSEIEKAAVSRLNVQIR